MNKETEAQAVMAHLLLLKKAQYDYRTNCNRVWLYRNAGGGWTLLFREDATEDFHLSHSESIHLKFDSVDQGFAAFGKYMFDKKNYVRAHKEQLKETFRATFAAEEMATSEDSE